MTFLTNLQLVGFCSLKDNNRTVYPKVTGGRDQSGVHPYQLRESKIIGADADPQNN